MTCALPSPLIYITDWHPDQSRDLEMSVSNEEIKKAVGLLGGECGYGQSHGCFRMEWIHLGFLPTIFGLLWESSEGILNKLESIMVLLVSMVSDVFKQERVLGRGCPSQGLGPSGVDGEVAQADLLDPPFMGKLRVLT
ncbi:hypothetical protein Tco_1343622 [Tanacetum coccineum]